MTVERLLIATEPELGEFVKYEPLEDTDITIENIHTEVANIYTAIGVNITLGRPINHYNERLVKLKEMLVTIS